MKNVRFYGNKPYKAAVVHGGFVFHQPFNVAMLF